MQKNNHQLLSIAPMMGKTDTHFRFLSRILSKKVFLYTEMITTGAILYGRKDHFLKWVTGNPLDSVGCFAPAPCLVDSH